MDLDVSEGIVADIYGVYSFFPLYINEINEKQLWEGSHIVLF